MERNELPMPDVLYHYTNIEALTMILKNRTIRFTSLTELDDVSEGADSTGRSLGRFVFVSSWTDDRKESIPMWNMYASMKRGVRISLPAIPFSDYGLPPAATNPKGEKLSLLFPWEEIITKPFIVNPLIKTPRLLKKVEYSDSEKPPVPMDV